MITRVLHVDDHALTRSGCRMMLANEPDFVIVAEAECGAETIPLLTTQEIDLVILDIALPDINGLTLLAEIKGRFDMPVCILTGQESVDDYRRAEFLGAEGIALKGDAAALLVDTLRAVRNGERCFSPGVTERLAALPAPPISFSPRQAAVLHYVSIGETNKEIAARLAVSKQTVSFHLSEIRRKLGLDHNKRILSAAHDAGLL